MRLSIIGILLLIGLLARAQSRQGYIDYEKAAIEFPQYRDGQKEVETRTNQLDDSLKILADIFQNVIRGEYPRNMISDSSFRKKIEDKLYKAQMDVIDFQERSKKEIRRLQDRYSLNLRSIILKELSQFSTDNNVVCVVDKKSILYCSDCKDFTDDFISYRKEKRK
jgi:Skp family chaperone for outer membrane proteins